MSNKLSGAHSPYLLQHKDNPVDWYPWGEEALEKARRENKPIFLSIGYAACHWCHVMAHESFEDPETAQIMNEHFVNIKVDREERPDLDGIYMKAVVAMTGQGGWPMSVFLTPSGEPFYGGTYFPPRPRGNLPSFPQVLRSIAQAWEEDRDGLLESSAQISQHLQRTTRRTFEKQEVNQDFLEEVVQRLYTGYDWTHGGWGQAPKFPQGMVIDFLLTQATRENRDALDMASHALTSMAKGGMFDILGGGFSRYSVDPFWLIPHFEKMLYDNALLAKAYLHGYLLTGNEDYRDTCQKTLDFVIREMTDPQGGFYSSLDADSEGQEGKFYIWSQEDIQEALPDPEDHQFIIKAYGVSEEGNFEGKNVLQRALSDQALAEMYDLSPAQVRNKLAELNRRLLKVREERVRPGTDDKVLCAWNGWMLVAFAEAGRYLKQPSYTAVAIRNAKFLLNELRDENGRLVRSWRQDERGKKGYLEDYGTLILGLLALYQTDPRTRWFQAARTLTEDMLELFFEPGAGFYDTGKDAEDLLYRPQEIQDNATPSGSASAVTALLLMSGYEFNLDWYDLAQAVITSQAELFLRQPLGFGQWLTAADLALGPLREVAVLGSGHDPSRQALLDELWDIYRPRTISAVSGLPVPKGAPVVLKERSLLENQATAYVCQDFTCRRPITDSRKLRKELDAT